MQPENVSREAIALQIAEMKQKQAEQRAELKAQREAAQAQIAIQREAAKAQREAATAALAEQKALAKAQREAERAARDEAKLAAEQEKIATRAAREAERLEREKVKLANLQERLSNPQIEQNGIRRPKDGTKCAQAWDLFDVKSAEKGAPVAVAEVLTEALTAGLNEGNVRAEYSRWRRFHGIFGRVTADKPADAVQAAA